MPIFYVIKHFRAFLARIFFLFSIYDKSCFEYAKDYQSIGYAMPRHRVIDIDTPEDWDYACAMAKAVEELKLD